MAPELKDRTKQFAPGIMNNEGDELTAIFVSSIKTSQQNQKS